MTILTPTITKLKSKATLTKSPLSPVGVQGKAEELYSLNKQQLDAEALAVQIDFKSWIKENFFLSFRQRKYLDNLGHQVTCYFGSQCSVAFTSKLPIELIYPFPPETDYSKWTGSSNSLTVKSNAEGQPFATGKLTFEFSYTV